MTNLATMAAVVSSTGIVSPDYADIYAQLQSIYWSIYGSDADLDPDSQDGQFLGALAQAIYDCNQTAVAVYNSFSPTTAQGTGLSSVVKINGIKREIPTNSQVAVAIVGVAGTAINNGIVGDDLGLGTQWALPPVVNIPGSGTVTVTATCTTQGSTTAAGGTLTEILTPTRGWQTVTNPGAATTGAPVETDAQLRVRQSRSVALPSLTILEGIFAAVDAVQGVTDLAIYNNDTDVTDGNGVPAHNIAVVVGGGDVDLVAQAIASKKSPGTGTYGTTNILVIDQNGVPDTINFFELIDVIMHVEITITPLTGYVSTTGDALIAAVVAFMNGLSIGEDSYLNRLFTPANLGGVGLGATFIVTAITQARGSGGLAAADVVIAFDETATLITSNVTLVT